MESSTHHVSYPERGVTCVLGTNHGPGRRCHVCFGNQPWSYYTRSLFWMHSETGNVWTHLISPIIIIGMACRQLGNVDLYTYNNEAVHYVLLVTVTRCIVCLVSTMAHLLHSKSIMMHFIMFSLDYTAIGLSVYGYGVVLYHSAGNSLFYRLVYPALNFVVCLGFTICASLSISLYKLNPIKRRLTRDSSILAILSILLMPLLCRLCACVLQNNCLTNNTNIYRIWVIIMLVIGGSFFYSHFPQRWWPGTFDMWGHGHQWFHVTFPIGHFLELKAIRFDLENIPESVLAVAKPNITNLWCGFLMSLVVNTLAVSTVLCKVRHVISNEKYYCQTSNGKKD